MDNEDTDEGVEALREEITLGLEGESIECSYEEFLQARAVKATSDLQQESIMNGTNTITPAVIDAGIRATRGKGP